MESKRYLRKEDWISGKREDCTHHILCKWIKQFVENHKIKGLNKVSGCKTVEKVYKEEAEKII